MAYLPGPQSVNSGTIPWIVTGSVQGTVSVIGMLPAGTQLIGSVAVLQGTNPWRTLGSVSGTVDIGTIPGSILSQQSGTRISSVINSAPSSLLTGASIFGMLPLGTQMIGSVAVYSGQASWNVGGSVLAQQMGTRITSVINSAPSSLLTGASIFGMLPAGTQTLGSVAVLQSITPWITTNVGSIAVQWQVPSIVGTYAEDAGHTSADKGLFVLGVRNDTLASFVSADLEYNAFSHDSAGRVLTKPFAPDETAFTYQNSVVSGSVTLVKASAIGKRSYITDFWLVNSGSVATLITWQDGSASTLGYAVAPAGTGANSPGINIPIKTAPSQDLAFKMAPSASILYITVTGYQAP